MLNKFKTYQHINNCMMPITNDLINEIVHRIVTAVNPEEIILFGSYAWGTPHKYSDIDLCVIVPNDIPGFNRIEWGVRALNALDDLIVDVDILVKTSLDVKMFKSVPASLTKKIVEQGKYLYGQGKTYTNTILVEKSKA